MPTNGRLSKTQFNQAVTGGMGSGASAFQQLHLWLGTQNRKSLTHISAASYSDSGPISTADRLFRLVVCTGPVPVDQENLTVLDMSVISTGPPTVTGINRIFLDQVFKGSVEIDFDEPIVVEPNEQLNVLLGLSWANGDSLLAPSTSVGRLAWQGWEGNARTNRFPYDLR